MATHGDLFGDFVAMLARALDDAGSAPADLAAQLFVSRSHLDRIVSAVAGESPVALRRRLLLERAAYRLSSTDATILDVATEAGYGSHEAFTRAFARGFGMAPAQWRRGPAGVAIGSPNNVHFQPPGSIRLPGLRKVSSMNLIDRMVDHHVWLTGEFVQRAARLPDEVLDEPIEYGLDDDPDQMTLRRLLSRLVGQMAMWNAALALRPYDWDVEQHESVASMRERLRTEGATFGARVHEAIDLGQLDDTFVDTTCTPPRVFTYGGMIAHVLTFAAHRRTLVALALDKHGIGDLGWGDPLGWVPNDEASVRIAPSS
ncbi:AraC family transcriptional regulator [Allobranchiibius sp. GilTou38]|uniref:helix-turn-helix transcriptional regulator n=1 Tax=Allobranchiibius sp. GilTou38 TaxID=2815210 RepID=UPI001AA0F4A1|nr:AraC family transcriptional regulator [Allobranchiibius sp. GilTou38]MBO1767826.1 helix-turn-helix transcriptional regulator [Allobranchiibius sp. GilTou38]